MQRICPRLALGADRRTALNVPDADHRCLATDPPSPLERSQQLELCLTDAHAGCPLLRAWVEGERRRQMVTGPVVAGYVRTRVVLEQEPTWRGLAANRALSARPRVPARLVVAVGAIVLLVAGASSGALAGVAELLSPPRIAAPVEPARATPSPLATASPRATPSPSPQPTASPAAIVTAPPAPAASPSPSASPVAVRTYVVQPGDTLSGIAELHGTTVQAIVDANGLSSVDVIVVGRTLEIP